MYLETYSMEELMEIIEEKGYCSVEAVEILKEMEQAKKGYDFLLRDCEEKSWKTDQVVVDYYYAQCFIKLMKRVAKRLTTSLYCENSQIMLQYFCT